MTAPFTILLLCSHVLQESLQPTSGQMGLYQCVLPRLARSFVRTGSGLMFLHDDKLRSLLLLVPLTAYAFALFCFHLELHMNAHLIPAKKWCSFGPHRASELNPTQCSCALRCWGSSTTTDLRTSLVQSLRELRGVADQRARVRRAVQ